MARPIANPITYGTIVTSPTNLSNLDTSFGAIFTTGFNDSSLGWVNYAADTGTANAYSATLTPAPSSYAAGMCLAFTPQNSSTGASTINVNSLGTKAIVNKANLALSGGEIVQNVLCGVLYDGTSFRIFTINNLNSVTTNAATITLNCAGYDSVTVVTTLATATNPAITLNNLGPGVSVFINVANISGANRTFTVQATDPTGTNFGSIQYLTTDTYSAPTFTGGGGFNLQSGATITTQTIGNSTNAHMFGITTAGALGLF